MPRFNDPVIAPAFLGHQSGGFGVTFYVSNTTNPGEDQGSAGPTAQGRSPKNPFSTIARAQTEAVANRGDLVVIQGGTYTEAITFSKAGVTYIAASPFGYPDKVVIRGASVITAANINFYNIEFFSNSATNASVRLGAYSDAANLILGNRFQNCSFASDGTTEPAYGVVLFGGNNVAFLGCRFIDNTRAISIRGTLSEKNFGTHVEGCHFIENTTSDFCTTTGNVSGFTDNVGNASGMDNLVYISNTHAGGVVIPTTFVSVSGVSSGIMSQNRFASATNSSSTIVIPAGILYATNYTEAGASTARPA